jgi:hypothetical protein
MFAPEFRNYSHPLPESVFAIRVDAVKPAPDRVVLRKIEYRVPECKQMQLCPGHGIVKEPEGRPAEQVITYADGTQA